MRADYLRRAVWKAAVLSSVLTIALAFGAAYLTGSVSEEDRVNRTIEKLAADHAELICVLSIPPHQRTPVTSDRCYEEANTDEGGK